MHAADELTDELVYAGFSLGVVPGAEARADPPRHAWSAALPERTAR